MAATHCAHTRGQTAPIAQPEFSPALGRQHDLLDSGDQFYLVALPWLILQLTGSSIVLCTITMMAAIPRAAFMLLGGAVTDRTSPRRIMILTASSRTVLVAAVSGLIWLHLLQLWQLYILALCFGIADAFAGPAAQAYLPSLVAPEQLAAANSVSQSTVQAATLIAPGPAGCSSKPSAWRGHFSLTPSASCSSSGALAFARPARSLPLAHPGQRAPLHSRWSSLPQERRRARLSHAGSVCTEFCDCGSRQRGHRDDCEAKVWHASRVRFTDVCAGRWRSDGHIAGRSQEAP